MRKISKYLEFVQSDLEPVKSFEIQEELNPKIWNEDKTIKEDVKEQLIQIAYEFYEGTDLDADIQDVILTGSLANYNWSEHYSDYDLHILIDFSEVSDDIELVKKYVDGARKIWNDYYDVRIEGYEVEVYIQEADEPHISSGMYSLMNEEWIVKPSPIDFELPEDEIKDKARPVMEQISDLEKELEVSNDHDYEKFQTKIKSVWNKVKNFRKSGLAEEGGEMSIGNLVFKLLRRNGYIGKIMDMKRKSYEMKYE